MVDQRNNQQKVTAYLYDLSQGMAKQFSPMFLGRTIEGIWHTGLVVFGVEYFFGGGICQGVPKTTPYGLPIREIDMGYTTKTQAEFHEFLRQNASKFTIDTYDLFKNNCNNFTDACCKFLVNAPLPEYITGLPDEVLKTPFGQMIKPMVDNFTNQLNQQTSGSAMFPQLFEGQGNTNPMFGGPTQPATQTSSNPYGNFGMPAANTQNPMANINPAMLNNLNNMGFNLNPNQMQGLNSLLNQYNGGAQQQQQQGYNNNAGKNYVIQIKNFEEYADIVENSKGVVVDFFSFTCPPCMQIKPIFEKLAEEYSTKCPEIKFCAVNCSLCKDVPNVMGVSGIPDFVFYHNTDLIHRFKGANQNELRSTVLRLANMIGMKSVPNEYSNEKVIPSVKFNVFNPSSTDFYFYKNENFETPIGKIKQHLQTGGERPPEYETFLEFEKSPSIAALKSKDQIEKMLKFLTGAVTTSESKNTEKWVPFLDILRSIIVNEQINQTFIENHSEFISELLKLQKNQANNRDFPKAVRILILRLVANLFASQNGIIIISTLFDDILDVLTTIADNITDDKNTLQAITMIAYNIVLVGHNLKLETPIQKQLLKLQLSMVENQVASQDETLILVALLSILHLTYKNDPLLEHMKSIPVTPQSPLLSKLEAAKDEKVVNAVKDIKLVLSGAV